jgi:hypothetical protein
MASKRNLSSASEELEMSSRENTSSKAGKKSSFASKRRHWVHLRRPQRRNPARQQRDEQQQ